MNAYAGHDILCDFPNRDCIAECGVADGSSSKFGNSPLAERLYEFTLDSSEDASLGESESFGWYALFAPERAILDVDSQGFVGVVRYDDESAARTAWTELEERYEEHWVRGVVDALDASECDELFLIIDTARHINTLPSLDEISHHIQSHPACHDRNAWALDA